MIKRYNIDSLSDEIYLNNKFGDWMKVKDVLAHNAKVKEQLELGMNNLYKGINKRQVARKQLEKALELLNELNNA